MLVWPLGPAPAYEAEVADWLTMIQTIVGLTYLTRENLAPRWWNE